MNRLIQHIFGHNGLSTKLNPNLFFARIRPMFYTVDGTPETSEKTIKDILSKEFPAAKEIKVEDVSGGCGAMFNILVETQDFKGLSIAHQHRRVYSVLQDEIQKIHGLHIVTKVPV